MTNPPYILEHLEQMVEIFKHPRVFAFLHVPVQACADAVLLQMKRKYTCEDFLRVVDFLRERVPEMTIATDVICGFPTETADHFDETLKVFEKYRFPVVNISQFYPRPGTPAARMPRVATSEVKRRSIAMTRLFESYQTYNHLVGKILPVLITEIAADRLHMVGHTKAYVQVLLPHVPELMGKMVTAHILSATKFSLLAEVVQADEPWELPINQMRKRNEVDSSQSSPSADRKSSLITSAQALIAVTLVLVSIGLVTMS
jgi:threonylcarbamoyladenosine tRNA methylthiotransferase CDKAL1